MVTDRNALTITPQSLRYAQDYQLVVKKEFTVTNNARGYILGSDLTLNFKAALNDANSLRGSYSSSSGSNPLMVIDGNVILSFSNTEIISSIEIVLVVPEGATLSIGGQPLLLSTIANFEGVFATTHDFSGGKIYTYLVTAQDGSSQTYVLRAVVRDVSSKSLISFVLSSSSNLSSGITDDFAFDIDETNRTITAWITNMSVRNFIPTIIHSGVNISPASGVAQDFSTNLTYTVTAEDNSTVTYAATLTPYYSVVFDANGGSYSGTAPTNYVRYGDNATALNPEDSPTQQHKTVSGWSATRDGVAYAFNIPITDAAALYALWTNKQYTVTFKPAG